MNAQDLQYFHAALNMEFFGGTLEAVIIQVIDIDNTGDTQAAYIGDKALKPCSMWFDPSLVNTAIDDDEKIYVLTVLLHEMVHQEIFELFLAGLYTIEEYEGADGHGQIFIEHANTIGMTHNGYGLSNELHSRLLSMMHAYYNLKAIVPII